ncbi:Plasmid maintenance system antidote protein VapI [Fructobacillus tropaeoli]|nr:Plasmid maintenance system antidote protein VapI [Fructobacillus tropaeoli]
MQKITREMADGIIKEFKKSGMDILQFAEYTGISSFVAKKLINGGALVFSSSVYERLVIIAEEFGLGTVSSGDYAVNRVNFMLIKNHQSIEELADMTGIEVGRIRAVIRGTSEPQPDEWTAMAKALHVSKRYLMGIEDNPGRTA